MGPCQTQPAEGLGQKDWAVWIKAVQLVAHRPHAAPISLTCVLQAPDLVVSPHNHFIICGCWSLSSYSLPPASTAHSYPWGMVWEAESPWADSWGKQGAKGCLPHIMAGENMVPHAGRSGTVMAKWHKCSLPSEVKTTWCSVQGSRRRVPDGNLGSLCNVMQHASPVQQEGAPAVQPGESGIGCSQHAMCLLGVCDLHSVRICTALCTGV